MRNLITYAQISPLVKHVEIASDMVHCHFYCPVKSKKIVAITRFSKFTKKVENRPTGIMNSFKKYFTKYEVPVEEEGSTADKENAIVHAFGKISERFIWSEPHKHFIYKF